MNFYNPYLYSIPVETGTNFFSKLSLSSIINGTSKTLNLVNQAIPVVKQVSPIIKNLKTMFNVMNEFKKTDIENTREKENNSLLNDNQTENPSDGLTFFI